MKTDSKVNDVFFFSGVGNFSFGDYFKSDACSYAWEFVTENLGLDPDRLWVTVHESDDEAEEIWINEVGVSSEKIQRLGEDNYWKMAETGPCGPCSEIFWDKGPEFGADGGPAHGDEERFIEIWNLVFMQFEQHSDGSSTPLPSPAIDRICHRYIFFSFSILEQRRFILWLSRAIMIACIQPGDAGVSLGSLQ